MRKNLLIFLTICSLILSCQPSIASAEELDEPPLTEAEAAMLMDSEGNVLYEKNSEDLYAPASITKIMCAMCVLDAGVPLDKVVSVPPLPGDWENSQMAGFYTGSTATIEDLMKVLLVYSANDAASILAITTAGSESAFVEQMNKKATDIGMSKTTFKNPHGLEDAEHMSCAKDLITMGKYALENYPFISKMVHEPRTTITVNGSESTYRTTDDLMHTYWPLIGIKTGSLGYQTTFLGAAYKNGIRLYSCVLGCKTDEGRFDDSYNLLEWGFSTFKKCYLAKEGEMFPGDTYHTFAFNMAYKIMVVADKTTYGYLQKDSNSLNYKYVRPNANSLLIPGEACGTCTWTEGERFVNNASFRASYELMSIKNFGRLTKFFGMEKESRKCIQ